MSQRSHSSHLFLARGTAPGKGGGVGGGSRCPTDTSHQAKGTGKMRPPCHFSLSWMTHYCSQNGFPCFLPSSVCSQPSSTVTSCLSLAENPLPTPPPTWRKTRSPHHGWKVPQEWTLSSHSFHSPLTPPPFKTVNCVYLPPGLFADLKHPSMLPPSAFVLALLLEHSQDATWLSTSTTFKPCLHINASGNHI